MAITIPTTLTGGAQTGFTSPTYTTAAGTFPGVNGRLNYVTAIGGTQTGVRVHSVSDPFTVAVFAPIAPKALGAMNNNGIYTNVPVNVYGVGVRKGLIPALNQPSQVGGVDVRLRVPAGSDGYDAANVRAMISAAVAMLNQLSAGLGDTATSGQL